MFYQVAQYIKFFLKSTNQHGVHSPFVFNLVTKCFYDKNDFSAYKQITKYKTHLLKNDDIIKVKDLGLGSKKTKANERQICEIAKNAGSTFKRTKLLYRITKYLNAKNILELGTSLGIATQAMSIGNSEANITSIEGCPNISRFTKSYLNKLNANNVQIITGDFNDEIEKLVSNKYDLIFFDGNHQKDASLKYFETLLKTATNDSVFIFDDIYWSKGMTEAWEIIKKHPKVTVSIDTFFWGFIFFRKEQIKEHFKIRV